MKHTLVITWESQWTSDDVRGDLDVPMIRETVEDLLLDLVDQDAQDLQVSIDGVTLAEQGGAND